METISLLFVWYYLIRRLILTNDESGELEDKKFGFLPGLRQARQKSKKFFKVVYIELFSFHTRSLDGYLGCADFRVGPCQVRLCFPTKNEIQGLMSLSVPLHLSLKFSCRSR